MALTRDFKETVRERLQRDPAFREALLTEAVGCLLSSDVEAGKSLLRDYVNATIGFGELGGLTDKSPRSLMRMLSSTGESARAQPVRDHRLSAATGRRAAEGPGNPVSGALRQDVISGTRMSSSCSRRANRGLACTWLQHESTSAASLSDGGAITYIAKYGHWSITEVLQTPEDRGVMPLSH